MHAQVVESADTLGLNPSDLTVVRVQVPSWALTDGDSSSPTSMSSCQADVTAEIRMKNTSISKRYNPTSSHNMMRNPAMATVTNDPYPRKRFSRENASLSPFVE